MKLNNKKWCRVIGHRYDHVTIKWLSGGPYMEWHACGRCGMLHDSCNQAKDWEPFNAVFDDVAGPAIWNPNVVVYSQGDGHAS